MKYIVQIKLGDIELHCRIEAKDGATTAEMAVGRLSELDEDNPARQEYERYIAAHSKGSVFEVDVIEDRKGSPVREGRFRLEPSRKKQGWWVVIDTEKLILISFQEHRFHETQDIKPLCEDLLPDALSTATALREAADWLRENHYDLLF